MKQLLLFMTLFVSLPTSAAEHGLIKVGETPNPDALQVEIPYVIQGADPLKFTGVYKGAKEGHNVHYFAIPDSTESMVTVTMTKLEADIDMLLFNQDLQEVGQSVNGDVEDERMINKLSTGVYMVAVYGVYDTPYEINISAKEAVEIKSDIPDPGQNYETAYDLGVLSSSDTVLSVKEILDGYVDTADIDTYKFKIVDNLSYPTSVQISVDAPDGGQPLVDDIVIQVFHKTKGHITTVDENTQNGEQSIVLMGPGEYSVLIKGYEPAARGLYEIKISVVK